MVYSLTHDASKYLPKCTIEQTGHEETEQTRKKYEFVLNVERHNLVNFADVTQTQWSTIGIACKDHHSSNP